MATTHQITSWPELIHIMCVTGIVYVVLYALALVCEFIRASMTEFRKRKEEIFLTSMRRTRILSFAEWLNVTYSFDSSLLRIIPSAVVCVLYVINTYKHHIGSRMHLVQAWYGCVVLCNLVLQILISHRPLVFVTRLEFAIEVISLMSLILARGNMWLNFSFLQAHIFQNRFFEVLPTLEVLLWKKPRPIRRQYITIIVIFFVNIYIFASGHQLFELLGDPLTILLATTLELTLVNALYFTFVTVFTVGYGDFTPFTQFGRGWMILVIMVGVSMVSVKIAQCLELLATLKNGRGSFVKADDTEHCVICGNVKWEYLKPFVLEFYSDMRYDEMRLVVMSDSEICADSEWNKFFKPHSKHTPLVARFEGSCMTSEDLKRARVDTARAIFVLNNHHNPNIYVEDSETLKRILTIRSFAPDIPIYAMCALTDSMFQIRYALEHANVGHLDHGHTLSEDSPLNADDDSDGMIVPGYDISERSEAICMQDVEMSMLAENVFCNGLSTLLSNLLLRAKPRVEAKDLPWMIEYKTGTENCLEFVRIPNEMHQLVYRDVALTMFDHGLVLLATKFFFDDDWKPITPSTTLSHSTVGLVLTFLAPSHLSEIMSVVGGKCAKPVAEDPISDKYYDYPDDLARRTPSWHEIAGARLTGDGPTDIIHFADDDEEHEPEDFPHDVSDTEFQPEGDHGNISRIDSNEGSDGGSDGNDADEDDDSDEQEEEDDDDDDDDDFSADEHVSSGSILFDTIQDPRDREARAIKRAEILQNSNRGQSQLTPASSPRLREASDSKVPHTPSLRSMPSMLIDLGAPGDVFNEDPILPEGDLLPPEGIEIANSPVIKEGPSHSDGGGIPPPAPDILPTSSPEKEHDVPSTPTESFLPRADRGKRLHYSSPPSVPASYNPSLQGVTALHAEHSSKRPKHAERSVTFPSQTSSTDNEPSRRFAARHTRKSTVSRGKVGRALHAADFERENVVKVFYGDKALPENFENHVLVCVIGQMGMMNLKQFLLRLRVPRNGHTREISVVAICPKVSEEDVQELSELDSPKLYLIQGNSLSVNTLKSAHYDKARSIVILSCEDRNSVNHMDAKAIFTIMTLDHLIELNANIFVCSMIDSEESIHLLRAPHRPRRRGSDLVVQEAEARMFRKYGSRLSMLDSRTFGSSRYGAIQNSMRHSVSRSFFSSHELQGKKRQHSFFTIPQSKSFMISGWTGRGEEIARVSNLSSSPVVSRQEVLSSSRLFHDRENSALSLGRGHSFILGSMNGRDLPLLASGLPRQDLAEEILQSSRANRDEVFEKQRYASGEMMIASMFIALLIREFAMPGLTGVIGQLFGTSLETQRCWVRFLRIPKSWIPKEKGSKGLEYRELCERLIEQNCVPLGLYRSGSAVVRAVIQKNEPEEEDDLTETAYDSEYHYVPSEIEGSCDMADSDGLDELLRGAGARLSSAVNNDLVPGFGSVEMGGEGLPAGGRRDSYLGLHSCRSPKSPRRMSPRSVSSNSRRDVPTFESPLLEQTFDDDGVNHLRTPPGGYSPNNSEKEEILRYEFPTNARVVEYKELPEGTNALPYVYTNPEAYTVVSEYDAVYVLADPDLSLKHLQ